MLKRSEVSHALSLLWRELYVCVYVCKCLFVSVITCVAVKTMILVFYVCSAEKAETFVSVLS